MRAVQYAENGGPGVLELVEVERPEPDANELLVEVKAAGVSPLDTYLREGGAYSADELPVTPGGDFAGVVAAVGEQVHDFAEGDRVMGITGKAQGGFAEYLVVDPALTSHLPPGVPFEQGAGIGNSGVAAWHALVNHTSMDLGDVCLVQGGTGGVGHIAVQLAANAGMYVVTTAGSEAPTESLRELGADVVLDYTREDLADAILDAAPGGVDVILDYFPERYFDLDVEVAATSAEVVFINGHTLTTERIHAARGRDLRVYFTSVDAGNDMGACLDALARQLAVGNVEIHVARRFGLAEAADAHRTLAERGYVGKLVVVP